MEILVFLLYINFFLLKVVSVNLIRIKNLRNFYSNNYDIDIIIKGNGTQNILSTQFNYYPLSVFVNGNQDFSCQKSCYLTEDINIITLQFSDKIKSFENMFLNLINIQEVDLSNYDVSQISSMANMFKGCTNLISVHLSNTNTYNLRNIFSMFMECTNLLTIDF